MTIILPALAVAFAAFCVWLGVRIVNRRERWAKRLAVVIVAVIVGYPLSFGPACWISSWIGFGDGFVNFAYQPVMRTIWDRQWGLVRSYARAGARRSWYVLGYFDQKAQRPCCIWRYAPEFDKFHTPGPTPPAMRSASP